MKRTPQTQMADKVTNVVFAGLGGQGVLKASDILADAAFEAGLDVKKAEVHGMSQRGGSVTSDVRFGPRVWSPMVTPGEADFEVVMEATQTEAARPYLAPGGRLLSVESVDAAKLPTVKALNVAMLGLLSAHLPFAEPVWRDAIRANFPAKLHDANFQAFEAGRAAGRKEMSHV